MMIDVYIIEGGHLSYSHVHMFLYGNELWTSGECFQREISVFQKMGE